MREDRADVIVPALQIYINVMRWAGATEIYVPKIGLADGLIQHLWEEVKGDISLMFTRYQNGIKCILIYQYEPTYEITGK